MRNTRPPTRNAWCAGGQTFSICAAIAGLWIGGLLGVDGVTEPTGAGGRGSVEGGGGTGFPRFFSSSLTSVSLSWCAAG